MSDNAPSLPQSRRGLARRVTVQAVYQWLLNEGEPATLLKQFREQDEGLGRADPQDFEELLNGTVEHATELTLAIAPPLDRPIAQLDPVDPSNPLPPPYEPQQRPHAPVTGWQ